ncbi:hypothetical protein MKX01_028555, partial [Papaver californicum]
MIEEGVRPDHFVFPKIYKACSELRNYEIGKDVYDYMLSIGFEGNPFVKKSILDMFITCGKMDIAKRMFEMMQFKDVVTWNMMVSAYASMGDFEQALYHFENIITWNGLITGYTQGRDGKTALEFFYKMRQTDIYPNRITISGALAACALSDNLKLGKEIHGFVIRSRMDLSTGVGSALISMYSGCGQLRLGLSVFKELSTRDVAIWNSIVAACAQ